MFLCVYMNPTIDKTLYFDRFTAGGTNRPHRVITEGAGKAVNAAAALRALGRDAKVTGVLYRSNGGMILDRLRECGADWDFFELEGYARTNMKLFDGTTRTMTEINESGPELPREAARGAAEKIVAGVNGEDTVILTGSLPPGCPVDFYAELIGALNGKGVRCVLDADGEALRLGIAGRPYFIKPNIDELGALLSRVPGSLKEVKEACQTLIEGGVSLVGVSMGRDGAVLCDRRNAYFAKPIRVEVQSTVGAGDSMVAGISAYMEKGTEAALRAGVAMATGSVTLPGTSLCTKELFEKYYPMVEIGEI